MRFLFPLVIFFLILNVSLPSFAIEDVLRDIDGETEDEIIELKDVITDDEWYFDMGGKTLREKLAEIKAKEINDISKSHYLLEEILTKKFDKGPVKTMHLFGYYRAGLNSEFEDSDHDLYYSFNDIDAGINGKLRDGKSYYEARLRFTPQHDHSFLSFMPSNMYIANASIPHHTVIVGNTRTPTGYEGAKSSVVIPLVARSQISRNFGNTRQLGVRVKGNYSLIEYDLGGYSSDTYFEKFFPGAEFAGWVTFKPLGKTDGKFGRLKMGTGLTTGQNDSDYTVVGAYTSYEYKKFYANFEWGKANGYNGAKGLSTKEAEGLYTTLAYRITPKLQFVTRYDQYEPNKEFSDEMKREYTAGINYFIKGSAVKLMLNYIFCQNDIAKDSHRIILGTQLLL